MVCAASTAGKRRENQDNYYVQGSIGALREHSSELCVYTKDDALLLGVFDGVGGMDRGADAAKLAAEELCRYAKRQIARPKDTRAWLERALQEMNQALCRRLPRSGSTAVLLFGDASGVYLANIGDSSAFLFRHGMLVRVSADHTHAARLKQQGLGGNAASNMRTQMHILTQYLGIPPKEMIIEPGLAHVFEAKHNDVYLLCSDGLTDVLDASEIQKGLGLHRGLMKKARWLIKRAIRNGSRDNITVLICKING